MYISLNKIKTYINLTENDPQKISDIITEKSAEIDDINIQGKVLENIVAGKILEISKHPDADSLRICQVDVGQEEKIQIVCGGVNLEINQDVVISKVGASVIWHGEGEPVLMKKTKIRGVESLGMICVADEVGLQAEFPESKNSKVVDLSALAPKPGTEISELMNKNDVIYEVENTSITNRADQFSHIGCAREFVACELGTWKTQDPYTIDTVLSGDHKGTPLQSFPISVKFPENPENSIPKYLAITVSGVNAQSESTPEMKNFLTAMGLEPKNALVDISNVVMFETGAPVHIFDQEKVGKKWEFQLSKEGEKMTTLDGDEKTLPADALIIKDESGQIFDLCGIQGGENSGICNTTKNIVIHVPIYDAVKIRRASIAVDHRTDASIMYEKTIPTKTADYGMARTLEIISEIFPESEISSQLFSQTPESEKTDRKIIVTRELINRVMGIFLENSEIEKIFSGLGFRFLYTENPEAWEITVPFFRGDIEIPEDMLEEIARMYGLNKIPAIAPDIKIEKKSPLPSREVERKISGVFLKNGFYEILTLAFLGEKLLNRMGLEKNEETMCFVKNPLTEEIDTMRASLSPRLFETAQRNIRFQEKFRIFESGNVFRMQKNAKTGEDEKIEEYRITALLVGDDFFTAKSIAEEIIAEFGMSSRISQKKYDLPFAHPARGAEMIAGKDASVKLFQIHPKTAKEFGIPENSSIVCITLKPFEKLLGKIKKVSALPKFPGISYDISVICDENLSVEKLTKNFKKVDKLITKAEVQSLWRGEGVETGKKSVTLEFEFRAEDRTLTEKEAKSLEKQIAEELEKRGGVSRF